MGNASDFFKKIRNSILLAVFLFHWSLVAENIWHHELGKHNNFMATGIFVELECVHE